MTKKTYSDKLKDPRWQRRRLEILESHDFICQKCLKEGKTVHVHHRLYRWDADPWSYEDEAYITLCEDCHSEETMNKKDCFKSLSETIQKNFYSKGMCEIDVAFTDIETKVGYSSDLIAGAIRFWLKGDKLTDYFMNTYFGHLRNSENNT